MNTKLKFAIAMLGGIVAGVMLVGTAVAVPTMMAGPAFGGVNMMRSSDTSRTFDVPTITAMNAFMGQYRAADGSFAYARMRADVTGGRVTPPCLGRTARAKSTAKVRRGLTSKRRGLAMMKRSSAGNSSARYGMMGSTY
jgi:hypothetical protein